MIRRINSRINFRCHYRKVLCTSRTVTCEKVKGEHRLLDHHGMSTRNRHIDRDEIQSIHTTHLCCEVKRCHGREGGREGGGSVIVRWCCVLLLCVGVVCWCCVLVLCVVYWCCVLVLTLIGPPGCWFPPKFPSGKLKLKSVKSNATDWRNRARVVLDVFSNFKWLRSKVTFGEPLGHVITLRGPFMVSRKLTMRNLTSDPRAPDMFKNHLFS